MFTKHASLSWLSGLKKVVEENKVKKDDFVVPDKEEDKASPKAKKNAKPKGSEQQGINVNVKIVGRTLVRGSKKKKSSVKKSMSVTQEKSVKN